MRFLYLPTIWYSSKKLYLPTEVRKGDKDKERDKCYGKWAVGGVGIKVDSLIAVSNTHLLLLNTRLSILLTEFF